MYLRYIVSTGLSDLKTNNDVLMMMFSKWFYYVSQAAEKAIPMTKENQIIQKKTTEWSQMLLAELTATFGTENLKLRSIIKLVVKLNKSLLCLLNKLKPDPAFYI